MGERKIGRETGGGRETGVEERQGWKRERDSHIEGEGETGVRER